MRPSILTSSGQYLDLLTPDPDCISIEAIAHALANTCRFGGHTHTFYSVAEHSARVALHPDVPSWLRFDALLHDAAEAFIGDIPTPLKRLLPEYREIEARIESAIMHKFGCYEISHSLVKRADLALLATERRDLLPADGQSWPMLEGVTPHPIRIIPLGPSQAEKMFLRAFRQYAPLDMQAPEGVPA